MKRMMGTAIRICATLCVLLAPGCGDRAPVQVCTTPSEVSTNKSLTGCFDGLDLLIVVDNSESMAEEQAVLASGLFTLVDTLVNPIYDSYWPWREVENIRLAVVSSDMGLQYGDDHGTEGFPYGDTKVPTCTDREAMGDDGRFQTSMPDSVEMEGGVIECRQLETSEPWAEIADYENADDLPAQAACLSQLGTRGCGVEQQLEAAVRGLSRKGEFMKDSHLLAVLVVSDEEDCSVKDKGLFGTDEWKSGSRPDDNDSSKGLLSTACNLPVENENTFLFDTDRYWRELVGLKHDQDRAVIFGAIVGVPSGDDSPCQGKGYALDNCLAHEDMQLEIGLFENATSGNQFKHFKPACERSEGETLVTSARPGRRYVKVAESFGANGYISSVCNGDWSKAMKDFALMIVQNLSIRCYSWQLEWVPLLGLMQEEMDCPGCGIARCDAAVTFHFDEDKVQTCPPEFGVNTNDVVKEYEKDSDGEITRVLLHCPLPKLPAELECEQAMERYPRDTEEFGWFYCENSVEDYDETCADGIDNDGVDGVDCEDPKCEACCSESMIGCKTACKYSVELTTAARIASRGYRTSVQCTRYFPTKDENCRENTHAACNDGKDNNGDGMWDCGDDLSLAGYRYADPNCCPMHVEDGMCVIEDEAFDNCKGSKQDLPDACWSAALFQECRFP